MHDLLLVGGGLQNGLIALSALAANPRLRIALVERGESLGGDHTWCFHESSLAGGATPDWLAPLVVHHWGGYRVRFPGLARTLDDGYAAITSARFDTVLRAALARDGCTLALGATARFVRPTSVELDDGRVLEAPVVIDARGPAQFAADSSALWQKFLGLELELRRPHALGALPTLIDADVEQPDGLRFVYVLPLGPTRVLVEDTYFSDERTFDEATLRARVLSYADAQGLAVERVAREEQGSIPLPTHAPPERANASPLLAGYAGGFFHPATGYSTPVALRLAEHAARAAHDLGGRFFGPELDALIAEHRRQFRHALWLNRALAGAVAPRDRRNLLAHFYRLPKPVVRRFYALASTHADRVRLVFGPPPRGLSLRAAAAHALREVFSS